MPRTHKPRYGSMQYSPRKRAKRVYPRVKTWPLSREPKLLGFAGYKAGMTHMFILDSSKDTPTSGKEVFTPITVLDCPPITPFLIRAYKNTPYGRKVSGEIWAGSFSKDLNKKINTPKSKPTSQTLKGDSLSILVHTQPRAASVPKKKPEIFEIPITGEDFGQKLNYATNLLGKELKASDIFAEGEFVDVVAVTTGKGFQGPVKRFGVKIQPRKQSRTGKGRHVGTLGDRSAATRWTVPQAGQTGYNTRTEFNKRILKIGNKGEEITPKGGFVNYGIVKNDFIVLKGSVPGPVKRLVRLRYAIRPHAKIEKPEIIYTSLTSKQGR